MDPLEGGDPRGVGRYRFQARLGSGGMGRVYLAFSPGGRAVAVKVVHPELARDPAFLARFRQEVAAARQVSGAYTAPVVDASGDGEDPPWLATVLVPGPSLAETVGARGPLSPESLWRLAAGLAEALAVIQSHGLVHRDLKPPNVLLAADGPRVIDFGISRALDATTATTTGMIVGTASFMSPEQAEGLPVGPASDVFSLGCVLAYAATGTGPFGAGTPASIVYRIVHTDPPLEGISGSLRDLIARCLAKDPAERATPAELMDFIAAQAAPISPALSFWPPDLADAIAAYQAQLTIAMPLTASVELGGAATPPPHEPTQVAAIQQQGPITEPTVTGLHASQAPPPPSPPSAAAPGLPGHSSPRRSRRAAIVAAASILAIAAVIAVGVAVAAKGPKPVPTPTPAAAAQTSQATATTPATALPQTVMSKDGVYVVGIDIQPGTYHTTGARSTANGGQCYYALLSSTNTNDIIDNNNVTGPATITIGKRVKAVDITDCNPWRKPPATAHPSTVMSKDGVYVVGVDIQPGTYRTTGARSTANGGQCYYALLSSTNTNDIIDNNNVTGPATITFKKRVKAIDITDCNPWRKRTTASRAAPGVAVTFGCKVEQTGPGQEEFNVSTTGGATYSGAVAVTFYDYAGSGDTFPPTSVQGAAPGGSWYPVPAADIGASAEPSGCIATAG
jgi:serine/threonine protein kinase